jgi:hypothetical protein
MKKSTKHKMNKCNGITSVEIERMLELEGKALKHTISKAEQAELDALRESHPDIDANGLSGLYLLGNLITINALANQYAGKHTDERQEPKSECNDGDIYAQAQTRAAARNSAARAEEKAKATWYEVRLAIQRYLRDLDGKSSKIGKLGVAFDNAPDNDEIATLYATSSCGEGFTLFTVDATRNATNEGFKVSAGNSSLAVSASEYSAVPLLLYYTDNDYKSVLSTFRTWLIKYISNLL